MNKKRMFWLKRYIFSSLNQIIWIFYEYLFELLLVFILQTYY